MATPSLHPLLHYLRCLGRPPRCDPDDAQLLRRFLMNREESAFAAIVQRYGAMVWGLCVRRLGETPEAEDAFQATFLVLVRKASSLRGPELLGPWLHGVAYRTALKVRGQRARRAARETPLMEQPAEPQAENVWSELRPVIDEEVNRLPEKYRRPVVLCYLQGLSSEEAAQQLGCAKGTVFSRLSRARDLLRRRLARRGLGVSAGMLAAVLADNAVVRSAPPSVLSETTIRTCLLFAAGTASQAMSTSLVALVEGVSRSMFLSKVKFAAVIIVALGLVGSGAGFVVHRGKAEQPPPKPASVPSLPVATADKAKKNDAKAQPDPPPQVAVEEKPASRDQELRHLLDKPVSVGVTDDPKVTLTEMLEILAKRYNLSFDINEHAFEEANIKEVGKFEPVANRGPVPEMHTRLGTVLQKILNRVSPSATYIIRDGFIEITTVQAVRKEFFAHRPNGPFPPLVTAHFNKVPLEAALKDLGRSNNVVLDSRAAKEGQTPVTADLTNVPLDTAVRMLADMAGLRVVPLDNVLYLTTPENAKRLREEQAQLDAEPTRKLTPEKAAK